MLTAVCVSVIKTWVISRRRARSICVSRVFPFRTFSSGAFSRRVRSRFRNPFAPFLAFLARLELVFTSLESLSSGLIERYSSRTHTHTICTALETRPGLYCRLHSSHLGENKSGRTLGQCLYPGQKREPRRAQASSEHGWVENYHTLHRPLGGGHADAHCSPQVGRASSIGARLADDDLGVLDELVRRDLKVERRRALADAAGGVIM